MPLGGQIRIYAGRQRTPMALSSSNCILPIRDPAFPLAEREKVFAPFYSTKATGFGLGLAITKKIVEDHGGQVFVTGGETPGTDVVVQLPFPQPHQTQAAALAASLLGVRMIPDAFRKYLGR